MSVVDRFGLAMIQHIPIDTERISNIILSVASAFNPLESSKENRLEPIIIATMKQAKTEKKKITLFKLNS